MCLGARGQREGKVGDLGVFHDCFCFAIILPNRIREAVDHSEGCRLNLWIYSVE